MWAIVGEEPEDFSLVPEDIRQAIENSIASHTKTYRYVLPTQILAKLVDPSLDSRAVQGGGELSGSFDARSLCHQVIVPFDRDNHDVLGGSPEPYVNNPLRIPGILPSARAAQRNKQGFDDLCHVLAFVEKHPELTEVLYRQVLSAINRRLTAVRIVYAVPNRVSLESAQSVLKAFLSNRSGGLRLQAVATALFRTIGQRFALFDQVEADRVNAADASTGSVADITCRNAQGKTVLAIEVKDQTLQLRHVQDKLPTMREQGVTELLFLVNSSGDNPEADQLIELFRREFSTGQNIYHIEFDRFLETCLTLLGESGRRQLLIAVGLVLDEPGIDFANRQSWRDLLAGI
jgi:hypothetical protein